LQRRIPGPPCRVAGLAEARNVVTDEQQRDTETDDDNHALAETETSLSAPGEN